MCFAGLLFARTEVKAPGVSRPIMGSCKIAHLQQPRNNVSVRATTTRHLADKTDDKGVNLLLLSCFRWDVRRRLETLFRSYLHPQRHQAANLTLLKLLLILFQQTFSTFVFYSFLFFCCRRGMSSVTNCKLLPFTIDTGLLRQRRASTKCMLRHSCISRFNTTAQRSKKV